MQAIGHDLACDSFFFLQVNDWKASVVDREPLCLVTSVPNAICRSCTLTPCEWTGKNLNILLVEIRWLLSLVNV